MNINITDDHEYKEAVSLCDGKLFRYCGKLTLTEARMMDERLVNVMGVTWSCDIHHIVVNGEVTEGPRTVYCELTMEKTDAELIKTVDTNNAYLRVSLDLKNQT